MRIEVFKLTERGLAQVACAGPFRQLHEELSMTRIERVIRVTAATRDGYQKQEIQMRGILNRGLQSSRVCNAGMQLLGPSKRPVPFNPDGTRCDWIQLDNPAKKPATRGGPFFAVPEHGEGGEHTIPAALRTRN
jgi:hypothetical protein